MPEDLHRDAAAIPRTLVALLVGLVTFVVLSSLRIRVQSLTPQAPAFALVLTLFTYVVSGFVTGLFLTRAHGLYGSALGILTVGVVWLELPRPASPLALTDLIAALLAFAALGVIACAAGSAAAGLVRARRGRLAR